MELELTMPSSSIYPTLQSETEKGQEEEEVEIDDTKAENEKKAVGKCITV